LQVDDLGQGFEDNALANKIEQDEHKEAYREKKVTFAQIVNQIVDYRCDADHRECTSRQYYVFVV